MNNKITPSLEDYLEKIYFLYVRNGLVRVTDVAVEMNISKPSVNKAINTLMKQGFVSHELYGHLNLTESGKEIAVNIAKRHEMLKKFLSDIIGVDEKAAEEEACLIEHSISTETVGKMEKFIENYLKRE